MTSVQGHCPACGWQSLVCSSDGYITCTRLECPRSTAADELLDDDETEHIVQFDRTEFTIRHPLRERLDDALMTCQLHQYIRAFGGPPVQLGRYRARSLDDRWIWERL